MISVKDEKGHSQVWAQNHSTQFRAQMRIEHILAHLKPNSHVLELGCGHGDLSAQLLAAGHRVTVLDRSEAMLEATKTRCHNHPALVAVQSDVLEFLERKGPVFDAVVGMGILHHCVLDLEKTLRLISTRLSAHGRGFFWEPNRENPLVRFLFGTAFGRKLMSLEPEENAFTAAEISARLKDIYPRYRVVLKDWAYPFMPVFAQKTAKTLESLAPTSINTYIAQSLWIEFYKSFEGAFEAKIETPK